MRHRAVLAGVLIVAMTALSLSARQAGTALTLQMFEGHPVVDGVFVNGHGPYRFLVDTGTSLNHLDVKAARAVGLAATFRTPVVSATGTTLMNGVPSVEIALSSARAQEQTVLLGGLDAIRQLSSSIQGVLGQSFLSRFDYLIDVRARQLQFGASHGTGTRVPLRRVGGRPAIDTNLGRLLLDSGAHRLVLFNIVTTSQEYELQTIAGVTRAGTVLRELQIGGRVFWRGDAIGVLSTEPALAGLLPINVFRSVYVSNSGGYVILN